MDDTTLLLTRMQDLVRKAQKTGCAFSKFLTAYEREQVGMAYKNRRDVNLEFDGGFDGAERCVAVFTQPDWGVYDRDEVLAGLKLTHRPQDALRHQDVLGAVLGLGILRDVLGDVFLEPGEVFVACLASMADYVAGELSKVARAGVKAACIPVSQLPPMDVQMEEKWAAVASLRLDAVLAAAFGWSRSEAAEAILAGKVQLAHRECTDPAKTMRAGDIFSARGKGRAKLVSAEGHTRKGRQKIVLGFFG